MLLSMKGIDKSFSGVRVLASASLDVEPGEVMALVGQNGAGKSTLIKILTGAYRRDAGSISFQASEVDFRTPAEFTRGRHCNHLPGDQSRATQVRGREYIPRP